MVDPTNSMFQSANRFNINGGEYITGHYTKNVYLAPLDQTSSIPSQSPGPSYTGRDNFFQALKDQISSEPDSDHDDPDPWDMFGPVVGSWVTSAITKKPEPFVDAWSRCASKITSRFGSQQRDKQRAKAEPKPEAKPEQDRETANPSQIQVLMTEYDALSSSLEALREINSVDSIQNLEERLKAMKRMREILDLVEKERTTNKSM